MHIWAKTRGAIVSSQEVATALGLWSRMVMVMRVTSKPQEAAKEEKLASTTTTTTTVMVNRTANILT
jgi:hypothetical protein